MENKNKDLTIISAIFLLIDILAFIVSAVFIVSLKNKLLLTFAELGVSLPLITRVALSNYYIFITIFIIAILILIIKEMSKRKLVTLVINIASFFIILFFSLIYILALYLPLYQIGKLIK